jgi:hypothetical protein
MTGLVIVPRAELANEEAVLLDQEPTPSSAGTAEPGTEALSTSEGPLLLDLHDLGFTAVGEGDFGMTSKTSDPDTWMVLQELTVAPFPWLGIT